MPMDRSDRHVDEDFDAFERVPDFVVKVLNELARLRLEMPEYRQTRSGLRVDDAWRYHAWFAALGVTMAILCQPAHEQVDCHVGASRQHGQPDLKFGSVACSTAAFYHEAEKEYEVSR